MRTHDGVDIHFALEYPRPGIQTYRAQAGHQMFGRDTQPSKFPSTNLSALHALLTQFVRDFVSLIEGTSVNIPAKELSGGAYIYIFNDVFGNALANLDATASLGDWDIRPVIRNSSGPRPSLFFPEVAFDLLVKPQIKPLEAPSSRWCQELVKIGHNCTSPVGHPSW